ncbi:hypothetical protein MTX20_20020 [Bradyrhizobium sp. ISRA435]|nr:hypothetical protein MTX20_20020 [Bradyrhizobium sp. ISRA435]
MSLTITGKVIEDENLGLTTLAADSDATDADNNVILSSFQSSISTSSSLGAELKSLGIYPDTTTNSANGTTQAIGIAENAIVSTTDQNLQFTNSTGGTLSAVSTGFTALDDNEIFLYSDSSNPDIVLGIEGERNDRKPQRSGCLRSPATADKRRRDNLGRAVRGTHQHESGRGGGRQHPRSHQ